MTETMTTTTIMTGPLGFVIAAPRDPTLRERGNATLRLPARDRTPRGKSR
jgi:hypothetical protein